MSPLQTRFFELTGERAAERLRALGGALEREGARVTLLASRDQEGLFLLVAEAERWPQAEAPAGARVWTFERVAA